MMRSFYQAISGMNAMSEGLSVTGNNIANTRTTGFKSRQALFEDLFYQQFSTASAPSGNFAGTNPIEIGSGVKMKAISIDHSQGDINSTGKKTDLAINGPGYFVVGDNNSQDRLYTRDGSFGLSRDSMLVTSGGQYVLGWNVNPGTNEINTGADVSPININLDQVSAPSLTTRAEVSGNLNANNKIGQVNGVQIPVFDTLGSRHDVSLNFVKTGENPNVYNYIATPLNSFIGSDSVDNIIFRPSENLASKVEKGEYRIETSDNNDGTVNISVISPSDEVVLVQQINDTSQTVTLNDGETNWFTIDYTSGGSPSIAYFQVAEVGSIEFDSFGSIANMEGSGPGGSPQLEFTSQVTGDGLSINVNIDNITGLATETKIGVTGTDGYPAAILKDFDIGDEGLIYGYFSDGTVAQIGQVALATFTNPSGLQAEGGNYFSVSSNSGEPDIGPSGEGDRGSILSYTLEESNVDIAKELTELMFYQKAYTANSKTIQVSNQVLDVAINLIR